MNDITDLYGDIDWLDLAEARAAHPSSSWQQHRPQSDSTGPDPASGTASVHADGGGLAPGG